MKLRIFGYNIYIKTERERKYSERELEHELKRFRPEVDPLFEAWEKDNRAKLSPWGKISLIMEDWKTCQNFVKEASEKNLELTNRARSAEDMVRFWHEVEQYMTKYQKELNFGPGQYYHEKVVEILEWYIRIHTDTSHKL